MACRRKPVTIKGLIVELAQAYQRLGEVQGRTGKANLGQLDEARRSYRRALDLYARLPVTAGSPPDLRRRVASVLLASGRLEYSVNREDAAEPVTRRMLDLLADRAPDPATRMLRALGERSLGEIRLRQGRTAEALAPDGIGQAGASRSAVVGIRRSGTAERDQHHSSSAWLARRSSREIWTGL